MSKEIIDYYDNYDEEHRLFRDNLHRIEWLTTMDCFGKLLPPYSRIFDGCAGTGNYSFALARRGHKVTASDIVPSNVAVIRSKQEKTHLLSDVFTGDICHVPGCPDGYFDVVLCMGAFYHLDRNARAKAMQECLRLLKDGGLLAVSYISLMANLALNLKDGLENIDMIRDCYKNQTFGDSFTYMTPGDAESMADAFSLKIIKHLTADGAAYFYADKINSASDEDFSKYMQFHLKTCEDKSILGFGLHGLIIFQK